MVQTCKRARPNPLQTIRSHQGRNTATNLKYVSWPFLANYAKQKVCKMGSDRPSSHWRQRLDDPQKGHKRQKGFQLNMILQLAFTIPVRSPMPFKLNNTRDRQERPQ